LKGKIVKMESARMDVSRQDELDFLLDKISDKGISALSKEERTRLEILSKPGSTDE
jgi:hypothetical protein